MKMKMTVLNHATLMLIPVKIGYLMRVILHSVMSLMWRKMIGKEEDRIR